MAGASIFGWDLIFSSVEKDIKNKQDVLVCLTHLVLISNGFKCIGLGESKTFEGTEKQSESLPENWNKDHTIRYVHQGKLYHFRTTRVDDSVILNLVRVDERNVGSVQLNIRQVAQQSGSLDTMVPDNKKIVELIKSGMIDKVVASSKNRSASSQTEPPPERSSRVLGEDPLPTPSPGVPWRGPGPLPGPEVNPFGYGQSDLNPFGVDPLRIGPPRGPTGGGGMLFQPPGRGGSFPSGPNFGIAPGSLPPGARFDPFRPPETYPNPRMPRRPDNDELPPPGYDDMFM
ncbi:unnamed protein product [Ceutorhynchus assimilis]|uniref:Proteasome inhibitor PI31 subunit n=1 Tax=Ceutorhynchus assimilis TaxID=467358 RepID=A0A9N9QKP6_9CUCU|nr:unnamed protein product [Ceutorhynchus assimilis]